MAKYVFDSNIFINLQRRQPLDVSLGQNRRTDG